MALAFTFTSCKNKEKCWKVTIETEYWGKNKYYVWATENEIDAVVNDYEDAGADATYEKAKKSESDCDDLDLDELEDGVKKVEDEDDGYDGYDGYDDYDDWY